MQKAVFFDRDGVLNHDLGYVYKIEDFKWINGAKQAIKFFNQNGYLVFVVTNQSGIARGFYTEKDVQKLHQYMQAELKLEQAHIDEFIYCPHHPKGNITEFTKICQCRKPEPGMLNTLLTKWNLKPENCILIGDKARDIEAAKNAHITGYLFNNIEQSELNNQAKQPINLFDFVQSKLEAIAK